MQQYPGPFPKKKWTKQARAQLKKIKKKDLIALLKRDNRWKFAGTSGARYTFYNPALQPPWDYVAVHYHNEQFDNLSLLLRMIDQICWSDLLD